MSMILHEQYPHYIRACAIGPEAVAVRAQPVAGRVIAVLRNAVYLETEDGRVICIVDGEIDGPLTLRVADLMLIRIALTSHPTSTFSSTSRELCITDFIRIIWTDTPAWTPQFPRQVGAARARHHAARVLARIIEDVGKVEGCAPLVPHLVGARRAVPLQPESARIVACVSDVRDAIQRVDYAAAAATLIPLLGLGPGLTPSGDDLVAGMVASLVWQARLGCAPWELAHHMIERIRAVAPTRTNRISARFLWQACEGVLYAPAMDLGAALLSGKVDVINVAANRLFSIGHTTGVDLATGLLLGTILGAEISSVSHIGQYNLISNS